MPKDTSLLQAALYGYQSKIAEMEAQVAAIQKQLGKRGGGDIPTPFKKHNRMSAAARKRIGAAQKKRWAEWKKAH